MKGRWIFSLWLLTCWLLTCEMSFGVGRIYHVDGEQQKQDIKTIETWHSVQSQLEEQVRLLVFCAERVKPTLHDYEYFQRDWDHPFVAAREFKKNEKPLHQRLIDELADEKTLTVVDTSMGQGSERNSRIEQLFRTWLGTRGKIPLKTLAGSIHKGTEEVKIHSCEPVKLKKELMLVACELRWLHEMNTRGIPSFIKYLHSSERVATFSKEEDQAPFCRALAYFVNTHLDLYGVPSAYTGNCVEEKSTLADIKDIMCDNVQRFEVLFKTGIEEIIGETTRREKPWLPITVLLNEKQLRNRDLVANTVQGFLEEERMMTPRNRGITPSTSKERLLSRGRPLTATEKIWERFHLIDGVMVGTRERGASLDSSEATSSRRSCSESSHEDFSSFSSDTREQGCHSITQLLPPPSGL